jgi:hypothetical protein
MHRPADPRISHRANLWPNPELRFLTGGNRGSRKSRAQLRGNGEAERISESNSSARPLPRHGATARKHRAKTPRRPPNTRAGSGGVRPAAPGHTPRHRPAHPSRILHNLTLHHARASGRHPGRSTSPPEHIPHDPARVPPCDPRRLRLPPPTRTAPAPPRVTYVTPLPAPPVAQLSRAAVRNGRTPPLLPASSGHDQGISRTPERSRRCPPPPPRAARAHPRHPAATSHGTRQHHVRNPRPVRWPEIRHRAAPSG